VATPEQLEPQLGAGWSLALVQVTGAKPSQARRWATQPESSASVTLPQT
jgi:hypothetical protein